VAEYTFAQIVLANKGFFRRMHHAHEGGSAWAGRQTAGEYTGNYETKVGIIGAGMIGKMVIQRLKSLDFVDVLVFDPFLPDEKAAALGVTKVSLETLFTECAVISNHLANNAQTQGMLNGSLFEKMGKYATFINTGRGAQVVEADLIAALKAEPTRTALLDVTYPEPPVERHPFYTLPNCLMTPHIAGSAGAEVSRMGEYMLAECKAYRGGKTYQYEVTEKMLDTMA
jgi:phosphoglycerate dehydrogenase-like enzyme